MLFNKPNIKQIYEKKEIRKLIQVLKNNNVQIRLEAIEVAAKMEDFQVVQPLIKIFNEDLDWEIRIIAAEALGEIGDERAIKPLSSVLGYKNNNFIKTTTIALGKLGDNRTVETLINIVKENKDKRYRITAIEALGRIGDQMAVEPLIAALDTFDEDYRLAIIVALGMIGDRRAIPPLIDIIISKSWTMREETREIVAEVLGKLIDKSDVDKLVSKFLDNFKIDCSTDINENFRILETKVVHAGKILATAFGQNKNYAIDSLIRVIENFKDYKSLFAQNFKMEIAIITCGEIGDARAVNPLIKILQTEKILLWKARWAAAISLGKINDDCIIEALVSIIKQPIKNFLGENLNTVIRAAAIRGLGYLKDKSAMDLLIELLHDKDPDIKIAAVEALGFIGDPKANNALLLVLQSNDEMIRCAAIKALGEIGDKVGVEPIIDILVQARLDVQNYAAIALGQKRDPRAVEPLINLLKSTSSLISFCKCAAAWALGEIKDQRAVEPLINVLNNSEIDLRISAVLALGVIGDDRALNPLFSVLFDKENEVVKAAIISLGRIKDRAGVHFLIQKCKNGTKEERKKAIAALGKIRCEEALELLIETVKGLNEPLRKATANALISLYHSSNIDESYKKMIFAEKALIEFGLT